ncbi:unnamed protein product, partial [Allacma fusca]
MEDYFLSEGSHQPFNFCINSGQDISWYEFNDIAEAITAIIIYIEKDPFFQPGQEKYMTAEQLLEDIATKLWKTSSQCNWIYDMNCIVVWH